MNIYVKLTRPEGYEDVHPSLVVEDAGIPLVFEPEDVTAEIATLRTELADASRVTNMLLLCPEVANNDDLALKLRDLIDQFIAAKRQLAAAQKDAERYWWLRGNGAIIERDANVPAHRCRYGIGLDAAIDAAMKYSIKNSPERPDGE